MWELGSSAQGFMEKVGFEEGFEGRLKVLLFYLDSLYSDCILNLINNTFSKFISGEAIFKVARIQTHGLTI